MWENIWNFLCSCWNAIKDAVIKFFTKVVSFARHIFDYFKGKKIKPSETIFIADAKKLESIIKNAPTRNVGLRKKLVEATYDEETNEIKNSREITSREWDEETKNLMKDDELVILT
ncbi:MAG TPA: hypothetical protein DDY68_06090 [Porphyromonadaceae bacterium]|nr:hypothetical protein [Porphyromonadaceae bacterium]